MPANKLLLTAALGALALPGIAQAHVSLHPNTLPAGSGPTLDVRVPNESSNARVVKVDMQVPPGVTFFLTQPVAGWSSKVIHTKLAKPIKTDDGTVTEEASEVIWTADQGRGTDPDHFQSFPIVLSVPGHAGQVLTFKTIQTYSDGKVVSWIQGPDADSPAPTVNVTAAGGFTQDQSGDAGPPAPGTADAATTTPTPAKPATAATKTVAARSGASKGLGIAALIIAIAALLAGLAALATRRRASVTAA